MRATIQTISALMLGFSSVAFSHCVQAADLTLIYAGGDHRYEDYPIYYGHNFYRYPSHRNRDHSNAYLHRHRYPGYYRHYRYDGYRPYRQHHHHHDKDHHYGYRDRDRHDHDHDRRYSGSDRDQHRDRHKQEHRDSMKGHG